MPPTEVFFYKEGDSVPVLEWLSDLMKQDRQAYSKCRACIALLEQEGHQLRRPVADTLRDGIHELRARKGNVQYRISKNCYRRERGETRGKNEAKAEELKKRGFEICGTLRERFPR